MIQVYKFGFVATLGLSFSFKIPHRYRPPDVPTLSKVSKLFSKKCPNYVPTIQAKRGKFGKIAKIERSSIHAHKALVFNML